jgi:hypothetical protein
MCVTPATEKPVFEHNTWDFNTDIPKTYLPSASSRALAPRRPWNSSDDPNDVSPFTPRIVNSNRPTLRVIYCFVDTVRR